MRSLYVIIALMLFTVPARPGNFLISLFNEQSLSSIMVSAEKGRYTLTADGNEIGIYGHNELLYIAIRGDSLMVRDQSGPIGVFSRVSFSETLEFSLFGIKPSEPAAERSLYYGNLEVRSEYGRLSIINKVDEHNYLGGVVEAEAGNGWSQMFYMVQAIISRTYLYGNINRHSDEDFHLCDAVHCQVYKGRLTGNETIYEAVSLTEGLVIVNDDNTLITAAFHSNCGGQTVNSEDAWVVYRSYLRSITDPYCRGGRNASWHADIDGDEWQEYLARHGFDPGDTGPGRQSFSLRQPARQSFYTIGEVSIPLRVIRNDWNLRSAWFDIDVSNPSGMLRFRGRGHGHGVGLCQEGAMEMAARGYNFIDILQFYYNGVKVKQIDELF
ncbi:MAG: SpoIID/LytB domain-containing protein [Marinilabiliales bacterium]|nr:MAG: SpoIID/LytB domain-containing protein [Marinilabiliales bacterium]